MMSTTNIELFKNLSQYDVKGVYYDFHNDYDCLRVLFDQAILNIIFQNIRDNSLITLRFDDVTLTKVSFYNTSESQNLTVDNLYRGRVEVKGELTELSRDERAYFYLEFYEGQKIEFWARWITLDNLYIPPAS